MSTSTLLSPTGDLIHVATSTFHLSGPQSNPLISGSCKSLSLTRTFVKRRVMGLLNEGAPPKKGDRLRVLAVPVPFFRRGSKRGSLAAVRKGSWFQEKHLQWKVAVRQPMTAVMNRFPHRRIRVRDFFPDLGAFLRKQNLFVNNWGTARLATREWSAQLAEEICDHSAQYPHDPGGALRDAISAAAAACNRRRRQWTSFARHGSCSCLGISTQD
jgi:hypothetical protein